MAPTARRKAGHKPDSKALMLFREMAIPRLRIGLPSADFFGQYESAWMSSAQLERIGRETLIEDQSPKSRGSALVSLRLARDWRLFLLKRTLLAFEIARLVTSVATGRRAKGGRTACPRLFVAKRCLWLVFATCFRSCVRLAHIRSIRSQ